MNTSSIHRWLADGFIAGEQVTPGAPWQIRITDELRARASFGVRHELDCFVFSLADGLSSAASCGSPWPSFGCFAGVRACIFCATAPHQVMPPALRR
jgi:hypothetical protein